MKKFLTLLLILAFAVSMSIMSIACKEEAADDTVNAGTAAEETIDEATGEASEEVVITAETSASCIDCHNDNTLIFAREVQWGASLHGSGMTFERNGAGCAVCHTSEGFTERIEAGTFEIEEDIENPSPINCRTCHNIHDTNTSSDWALTTTEPVTMELTGDIYDLGNSNLCANCHQPRTSYEIPVAGGGDIEITSTRFGPHHGPQSSMIAGVGGYGEEYTGSNIHYENVDYGCITCHMTDEAYGKQAGGHTMNVTYEYHGAIEENLIGCIECHEDIESFDRDGLQTEIEEMLAEVHELLVEQGLVDGESGSGITGTFTSEQVGALWNYKTVEEDRSMGVHNPKFAKSLLETALDALQ
jgi:nitrate/TMAO reductase-like tetraheme cytochrome c subunit